MPQSTKSTEPIAQSIIKQVAGTWCVHKLAKKQVVIEVNKVFCKKGVIHYPLTAGTKKKCKCGRTTYGTIGNECDFYMYSQYGHLSFAVQELKSRL